MGVAIAMGLMILTNAVVGGSLLRMAARTRKRPELLMGLGLFTLGPVSQLFSLMSGTGRLPVEDVSLPLHAIAVAGSAFGMACIFLFVRNVFRPGERWALGLTGLAIALLLCNGAWTLVAVATASAGTPSAQAQSVPGAIVLALFTAAFGWAALEAGLYHARARRQARIGLLEPVVVNRFLLWTVSSASAFVLGAFLLVTHLSGQTISLALVPSVAICVVSIVTGTGMYLAFLPPGAYLAWIQRRTSAAQAG
jgi:hypothetical protein